VVLYGVKFNMDEMESRRKGCSIRLAKDDRKKK
jgi:hypothetical protein